ncbi:MAG: efflux RND transporter periplasmic adaptor subunit [Pseudomonadota bacterium]
MKGTLRAFLALCACLTLFLALRVLRARSEEVPTLSQADLEERQGVAVELEAVALRPVQRAITLYGTVEGAEQAEVVATSPNLLASLHVAVGDTVRAGQLLASMRTVSLSPLGYPYEPLKVQADALSHEVARVQPLYEQGALTDQQFRELKAKSDAASAQLDSARAAVRITAPIAGTVTRIDFRPGELVPNDRPLMQVARIDAVVVELMAEANDIAAIAPGQDVEIRAAALPGQVLHGAVVERSLGAYPVLNQFRVRVAIDNPARALLPGFSVEAGIQVGSPEPGLAVPLRALVSSDEGASVWVRDAEGRALRVPVTVGLDDDHWVAVQGELTPGQPVVTLGKERVRHDGQKLLPVEGG